MGYPGTHECRILFMRAEIRSEDEQDGLKWVSIGWCNREFS